MKRFSITHFSVKLPIAFQCVAIHSCDCLQKWCLVTAHFAIEWDRFWPFEFTNSQDWSTEIPRNMDVTWMCSSQPLANHWSPLHPEISGGSKNAQATQMLKRWWQTLGDGGFCFAWYVFLGNGRPGSQTWWKISLSKLMFINFRTT